VTSAIKDYYYLSLFITKDEWNELGGGGEQRYDA
jgi:hypothetical protein